MVCSGSKKHVQIPIKEENNPSSSNKKCFKVEWCLEPMGAGGVNTDNLAEFPAFVLNAVKVKFIKKFVFLNIAFILKINKFLHQFIFLMYGCSI